jgi:DNA primase
VPGFESASAPGSEAAAPRKEWKKDWKPGGSWKGGRREPQDPTAGLPRRQPMSPADHALRMLLLESTWFERLSHEDQQLLHELPGPHGDLVQWLERYLVHHGPAAWPVLESALAEDGMLESAQRFTAGALAGEELAFEDFTEALRKLLRAQLEASSKALAAAGDAAGLRQVLARLRELDAQARVDTAQK